MRLKLFIAVFLLAPLAAAQVFPPRTAPAPRYRLRKLTVAADELSPAVRRSIATKVLQAANKSENGMTISEVEQRVEDQLQLRGYFKALGNARLDRVRPGRRLPFADVTAVVDQGSRYRLGAITFKGTKGFSESQLRGAMPIKDGDIFDTSKIREGLSHLSELYGSTGYIDFTVVPDVQIDEHAKTIHLEMDVDEGERYTLGDLHVTGGPPEFRARLLRDWEKLKGKPPQGKSYTAFFNDHRRLLPKPYYFMPAIEARRDDQKHVFEPYLVIEEWK